jgi:hypothetical protein
MELAKILNDPHAPTRPREGWTPNLRTYSLGGLESEGSTTTSINYRDASNWYEAY